MWMPKAKNYPARYETQLYLPSNLQSLLLQPMKKGLMVVACDTEFGLETVDRAWLEVIAERVESNLEKVVVGRGFSRA